jgi:transposase
MSYINTVGFLPQPLENVMRRYELTDDQWTLIEDLFPQQKMGRPRRSDRAILNGIFWILCSGAAWRDLPERYGPWKTVYHRFRQWQANELFDRILEQLHIELDERGLIDYSTWMADSTSVRASRAAAGAPKAGAPQTGTSTSSMNPTKKGAPSRKGAPARRLGAPEAV